jgi:hypothetical protein
MARCIGHAVAASAALFICWLVGLSIPESLLPVAMFMPGCWCCSNAVVCAHCSGTVPASVQVDVSGVANGTGLGVGCGAAECAGFNDSFVLPATASCFYHIPQTSCHATGLVTFQFDAASKFASLVYSGGFPSVHSVAAVSTYDCTDPESLAFTGGSDFSCDGSGATVDLTPL